MWTRCSPLASSQHQNYCWWPAVDPDEHQPGNWYPLAPIKTKGHSTKLVFLGREVDLTPLTLSLPHDKLDCLLTMESNDHPACVDRTCLMSSVVKSEAQVVLTSDAFSRWGCGAYTHQLDSGSSWSFQTAGQRFPLQWRSCCQLSWQRLCMWGHCWKVVTVSCRCNNMG